MSKPDDLRLIEDYLPIEAISAEASREKSVRKGHISTLHLWWARRPLVACRAAVYGALVPADRWVPEVNLKQPPEDPDKAAKTKRGKKKGLNRRAAKEFVERLCKYPGNPEVIAEAQKHILEAHAERLTAELAKGTAARCPPGPTSLSSPATSHVRRHHRRPRPAAARAGHVCRRRGDPAGSPASGLRSVRAGPEPGRPHHRALHAGLSAEIRQARPDGPRHDRAEERRKAKPPGAGWPRRFATGATGCWRKSRLRLATCIRRSRTPMRRGKRSVRARVRSRSDLPRMNSSG